MKTPSNAAEWQALHARIAALQVVACRLIHERVIVEDGTMRRVVRSGNETIPVRIGLCAPELRARQLACGHSTARYLLLEALEAMGGAGILRASEHEAISDRLRALNDAIHLLDHRKGEAEKRYAVCCERSDVEATKAATSEVRAIEDEHVRLTEEVRKIRRSVLERLEDAATPSPPVQSGLEL